MANEIETDAEPKAFERVAGDPRRRPARMEKLAYRAPGTHSVAAQPGLGEAGAETGRDQAGPEPAAAIARLEARLAASEAQAAARIEQLRRESGEGIEAARREFERQRQAALDAGAGQITAALSGFGEERNQYFAKVEREVVKLALAIAARILHREALLDPMLLAAAARIALGQLGETTGVRLRCPASEVERWRETLGLAPQLALTPEVVGDPDLAPGDCVLEARVGTVDLGVRAQLEEIERGFFDLLEQRPGGSSRP